MARLADAGLWFGHLYSYSAFVGCVVPGAAEPEVRCCSNATNAPRTAAICKWPDPLRLAARNSFKLASR
ncbi:hypothetical protein GL4_0553 [Methyloceanibacter caenitepidi]|uniref:Uncharacterized protein n=1 Tax=Methyloceanibacter caenitepidi TaxID=1384459 RepID=A0A0A8K0I1_9HYPH|nr:hypothetical protein GL4_0553 [Methyloceanibacter caenitepidi]